MSWLNQIVFRFSNLLICVFLICVFLVCERNGFCDELLLVKGNHFIVYYPHLEDKSWANDVLAEAEKYYTKIASEIDYVRYGNFWTWDNRVKIIVYPDKATFTEETGQPQWVLAGAVRDNELFESHRIVTYKQETGFLNGVLPHEISHLVLHDFIGFDKNIPLWFDEGVAQLQEKNKRLLADKAMRQLVAEGKYIPLELLMNYDIRLEKDSKIITIFYLQSVSIVDFLLKRYGGRKFSELCHHLKSGDSFEEAFRKTYQPSMESIKELEDKWVKYF